MAELTGIEWTDHTFNPWWGCEKITPGCAHCYAEGVSNHRAGKGLWGAGHRFRFFGDAHWAEPLKWDRKAEREDIRRRVFCASMADVFEERDELTEPRARLFDLIRQTPHLDWQILTKRPDVAKDELAFLYDYLHYDILEPSDPLGYLPNVWLGVSIENARHTWRADVLREIPAAVRFISAEPLLGSLFPARCGDGCWPSGAVGGSYMCRRARGHAGLHRSNYGAGAEWDGQHVWVGRDTVGEYAAPLDLTGIDWVIIGGESGRAARPMRLDWAREIRNACFGLLDRPRPAIFVKQLGKEPTERRHWRTIHDDPAYIDEPLELRDRKGGDWDEWPADLRIREFPASALVSA